MNIQRAENTHWSFWLIAAVALLWNLAGCINFLVQLNPAMLAHYRLAEQVIIEGRPLWATAGFAVAVFGGAAGSVLMLRGRSAALPVFVLSLAGVLLTMVHTLGGEVPLELGEMLGIVLLPILFALFLVSYSRHALKKGWIR